MTVWRGPNDLRWTLLWASQYARKWLYAYNVGTSIVLLRFPLWNFCGWHMMGSNHTPLMQTMEGLQLLNYAQTCHTFNVKSNTFVLMLIELAWRNDRSLTALVVQNAPYASEQTGIRNTVWRSRNIVATCDLTLWRLNWIYIINTQFVPHRERCLQLLHNR
jgi:hypothetical protein